MRAFSLNTLFGFILCDHSSHTLNASSFNCTPDKLWLHFYIIIVAAAAPAHVVCGYVKHFYAFPFSIKYSWYTYTQRTERSYHHIDNI